MSLILAVLVAASPVRMGDEPQVSGWSKDGSSFVWTFVDRGYVDVPAGSDNMELAETAKVAVAYDVGSRSRTEYLVNYKAVRARNEGYVKSRWASSPDKLALDAWRRANPLVTTSGYVGPRGESADVIVDEAPTTSWTCNDSCDVTLSVKKASAEGNATFHDGPTMFIPSHTMDVYWDPTGWRVAFVVWTLPAQTMRGMSSLTAEVYFVDIPRTRVQLLATARLEEKAKEITNRLTEANCDVTRGEPKKDRNATVIYAASGAEEDAKALAKLIKGATVEPLTWKPDAEIVVALGAPGAR